MSTISVPLTPDLQKRLDALVASGVGINRADVMRRALQRLAEEEAVNAIVRAQQEPSLHGNLRDLLQKVK